jgi:hypothetical protein
MHDKTFIKQVIEGELPQFNTDYQQQQNKWQLTLYKQWETQSFSTNSTKKSQVLPLIMNFKPSTEGLANEIGELKQTEGI